MKVKGLELPQLYQCYSENGASIFGKFGAKSGFYFGQSFSPLHSPETPVNRVFWVSNRVFAFSDQVLAFLHQEFAFLTSFHARKSNLYVIFASFWHFMLL